MGRSIEVPLLDLRAQYERIRPEIEPALARVLESQRFVLGPEVSALEQEIAAYCDTPHAVACASGSDALLLALMALGVGPGDEVLCPSYTFFATAGSIWRLGARPVFADIEPESYNLDPIAARVAAERCARLRAIVPVHLFGRVAEMETLLELGRELDVAVIEDAAQAIGARDRQGARAGSRGAFGCFSFYPTKNLGAYGDGGLVTTAEADRARALELLRSHGEEARYVHSLVGVNSRLDALQAAVLRVKLRHLDAWSDARRTNAAYYDAAFAAADASDSRTALAAGGLPLRTPRAPDPPALHVYNQYVIRVPAARRDPLRQALLDLGIASGIYYPQGLHEQACFAALGYAGGALPNTEAAARETLALPIYPELRRDQLDHVVESVVDFLAS